jgi:dihydroneopterin aldolase
MASIILCRITFVGHHGVSAAERVDARKFECDVELQAEVDAAEQNDRLSDTLDYTEIADIIVGIGTGPSHHLIESLGRQMLDALSKRFRKTQIKLELRKLNPPGCPGEPAYAAVRLES